MYGAERLDPGGAARSFLRQIRGALEKALADTGISLALIEWTEMRWGMVDVTASWPKEAPKQNIHAWIEGESPSFSVVSEGSKWRNDERSLKRQVAFVPQRRTEVKASGTAEHSPLEDESWWALYGVFREIVSAIRGISDEQRWQEFPIARDPRL